MDYLLSRGASATATTRARESALQAAASNGHIFVVDVLLRAGADPGRGGGAGQTAEQLARNNGHEEVALLLAEWENQIEGQGQIAAESSTPSA